MNSAFATSLDQLWRSSDISIWLALAGAAFFVILVLVAVLRADRSLANAVLTITTVLAVGVAVASTFGGNAPAGGHGSSAEGRTGSALGSNLPALACVDDLAGEVVLSACEKALFGSAESIAAAVSYAAAQLERLTVYGDVSAANKNMTPELAALRRSVERDRYGLIAHVLVENYRCTPSDCPAFRLFGNRRQVVANMEAQAFDAVVSRYASSWSAPASPTQAAGPSLAAAGPAALGQAPGAPLGPALATPLAPSLLTGKPTTADFPTSASTPAVSIMNPEPPARSAPAATAAPAQAAAAAPSPPAAKKPPAPKPPRTSAASTPVQLSPTAAVPPAVARE